MARVPWSRNTCYPKSPHENNSNAVPRDSLQWLCLRTRCRNPFNATLVGVLLSEDDWLAALYPGEIASLADYMRCTGRLRGVMGRHIEDLLRAGNSVVLDFPANTRASRQWMKTIFENANAAHRLYYLDVSDEECKRRLRQRNEAGAHRFSTSDAEFDAITAHFVALSDDEGFNIVRA
ncbi:cell division protein ZipA [Janthinobacterium sp. BJB412]|nr:cell division protein ZipA [Janthinobacterium sp. BJB412]